MTLLNVRLGADDTRRVSALRRAGVHLSNLVREAIRAEYERSQLAKRAVHHAAEIMQEIYAECRDPPSLRPRSYDVHDRAAAKRAIMRKLRGKRR
ncbi:MAG TPA: hypothetical protein VGJ84_19985 [Polyangiaceae bacterium]|jgi:hypothetical protein